MAYKRQYDTTPDSYESYAPFCMCTYVDGVFEGFKKLVCGGIGCTHTLDFTRQRDEYKEKENS
jgi:hypothetical protein